MGEEQHLDSTGEITLDTVKSRAVKGVVVLTGRTFFLSVISLLATGLLTVFLSPSQFGIFWIVSAIVNFLAYFSDIGLAAALIQKNDIPTRKDLTTTFTIQQLLIAIILIVLVVASPALTHLYGLSSQGQLLLYALGFSLFLSSLKTIPSILLERELEFGKLVIPQILENLVYNTVAVLLAWKGFGITSFTIAILLRGLVGVIAMYILKPWLPGFSLSKSSLKPLLKFGVPYQANSLLATLKDDGMTAVLGGILGPSGVGLLGWAQKWAQAPLRFFMDHVIKVTFPAFSRMQDEKESLKRSLERSIFFICFLVFPTVAGILVLAPILVAIIPKYQKWEPALIPLSLIAINTIFAAVTTQLTNLLNSVGKIKTTFKLMIMWTILTWLFVPFLSVKFGVNGAALGYALVSVSSIIAILIVRSYIKFSLFESSMKPFIASFIMFLILVLLKSYLDDGIMSVWILISMGILTYIASIYLLVGRSIVDDVKKSYKVFFSK